VWSWLELGWGLFWCGGCECWFFCCGVCWSLGCWLFGSGDMMMGFGWGGFLVWLVSGFGFVGYLGLLGFDL